MQEKMPKLKINTSVDVDEKVKLHKVKEPAYCPECDSPCYYRTDGSSYLYCSGSECGKSFKEDKFLKGGKNAQ